jgi:hypothetical protein
VALRLAVVLAALVPRDARSLVGTSMVSFARHLDAGGGTGLRAWTRPADLVRGGVHEPTNRDPSLDALALQPELAQNLPAGTCVAIMFRVLTILAACGSAIATGARESPTRTDSKPTLSLDEAAQVLGVRPSTMRAFAAPGKKYHGFRIDNGTRRLAFSAAKIAESIEGGVRSRNIMGTQVAARGSGPRVGRNERQTLEQERAKLPGQIGVYRQQLENERLSKAHREQLEWQIRAWEKRLAQVEARLAVVKAKQ